MHGFLGAEARLVEDCQQRLADAERGRRVEWPRKQKRRCRVRLQHRQKAAISKGVPLLVAGVREGKNDINARVDYFGVGNDLRTERPKPEAMDARQRGCSETRRSNRTPTGCAMS
jgi:hypothetical protein